QEGLSPRSHALRGNARVRRSASRPSCLAEACCFSEGCCPRRRASKTCVPTQSVGTRGREGSRERNTIMWTRRRFLTRGTAGLLGVAGTAFALPNEAREGLPDGSASRGMITEETNQAIDRGLEYLKRQQAANGAFGTNGYRGNVAVTSLAALAFMAGG